MFFMLLICTPNFSWNLDLDQLETMKAQKRQGKDQLDRIDLYLSLSLLSWSVSKFDLQDKKILQISLICALAVLWNLDLCNL